jgi:hypothetical protein
VKTYNQCFRRFLTRLALRRRRSLQRSNREARTWFAAGSPPLDAISATTATHCTRCEWDHTTVNIGAPEIRRYFRAADAAFFDRQSLRILSNW